MYPNWFMIRLTKELVGETHPRLRVPPERRRLTTDAGMRADHTGEERWRGSALTHSCPRFLRTIGPS